jgi:hypothetical protein
MKLSLGWVALIVTVLFAWRVVSDVRAHYEYSRGLESYWSLSVKASTLTMKADYLNRFVAAVDSAKLGGHNALFFPTPDNDFEQNVTTLRNLQHRMEEIRGMDVTSFAYQQAIAQITAQEQDEAHNMLGVIKGCWYLQHHFLLWDWVNVTIYLLFGLTFVIFGIIAADA